MYVISSKRIDEMFGRGWRSCYPQKKEDGHLESDEELAQRWRDKGYEVKQYYTTGRVRGYYSTLTLYRKAKGV